MDLPVSHGFPQRLSAQGAKACLLMAQVKLSDVFIGIFP
jgi:hypothetical protein